MKELQVTTSWDDGFTADVRVAELLDKYGVEGTFFIPDRNLEGRAVVNDSELRQISRRFEIGAHTRDHVPLTKLSKEEIERQIGANKSRLEDLLSARVEGFCYVRGKYDGRILAAVQSAGFRYARTTQNFCCHAGLDPFQIPVTIQLFPHNALVYGRNYFSRIGGGSDIRLCMLALRERDLVKRIAKIAEMACSLGDYFHLWGHSWELDEHDLWADFEECIKVLSRFKTRPNSAIRF